jgi:hypothetical protein
VGETRTVETVRQELAHERTELAETVDELRRRLGDATDVRGRIGSRALVLVPTAFVGSFVLAGGLGATMRYLARRGRERR